MQLHCVRALQHYSSMLPAAASTPITTAAALSRSALAPSVTGLSDVVLVAGGPGVLQSLAKAPAKHLIAVMVVVLFVQKYESCCGQRSEQMVAIDSRHK
jgi:hypothetical protein